MTFENELDPNLVPAVIDDLLAATIHQARQPLFVMQNCLSAAKILVGRQLDSPDKELTLKTFSQISSAIEALASSLSTLAEQVSPAERSITEIDLAVFVEDTFGMACFVARKRNLNVRFEIDSSISGTRAFDATSVQIQLSNWLLKACVNSVTEKRDEQPLLISANAIPNADVAIRVRGGFSDRQIVLTEFVS